MKYFVLVCFFFMELHAGVTNTDICPPFSSKCFNKINFLDQKKLYYSEIDGVKFSELSDLTYHNATQTLYVISDEGALFAFETSFSDTIDTLNPLFASTLKKKNGKKFKSWKRDSEGLTLDGKGKLLISFEGNAKIAWFHKNSSQRGNLIRKYTLPKSLRKKRFYRSKNKSLEALAWHPKHGILTATEWPLKKDHKKRQTIYALSGKRWHFQAEPEGKSGLVAMEVMDDGNILVLERSFTGMLDPFVLTLKKVNIKNCLYKMCKSEVLLKMNSHKGWDVENFEGLARVGKNRYVMISDDNDNFLLATVLVYFEVLD